MMNADLKKELQIIKLTNWFYHKNNKGKKAWYDTMDKVRSAFEINNPDKQNGTQH